MTLQVFENTAGLFRPTSSKSANITQHCKKLHTENMTKEVKKKKKKLKLAKQRGLA